MAPFLRRRSSSVPVRGEPQPRALTASATVVNIGDRQEAKRLQQTRQDWQIEAWTYRRNLGELRYATSYLGNSTMRLRLHLASYIAGESEPVELTDEVAGSLNLPLDLVDSARDALSRLGSGGPLALQRLQRNLTENFEIAGECYLVGTTDVLTGVESWTIRSINEMIITNDGRYGIRDNPRVGATSRKDITWLDKDRSVVIRLWWPDPEFAALADSPVRAVRDICEELLLLGREVRATAKSRLANNGILMLPDSLSVISASQGESRDPRMDPFLAELIATATAALADEGSASAVVPILLRGPEAAIAAVKHLLLTRPLAASNMAQRMELISRLATGIDLPSEVLTGKADLNHWTAWQIDDDSFRHHVEPIAIVQNDAMTSGYLWTDLDTRNSDGLWKPSDIRKIFIWHDPAALISNPDRTGDAKDAFDRGAIGRDALRKYLSMGDDEVPDELDAVLYVLGKARGVDPEILNSILKSITSSIKIPDTVKPPPEGQGPGAPPGPTPAPGDSSPADGTPPPENAPQAKGAPPVNTPPPTASIIASAAAPSSQRNHDLSRKLVDIDKQVRDRLATAANATMKRTLEKAGARVVSKARTASAAGVREQIRNVPLVQVPAKCGKTLLAALGLQEADLIDAQFGELHKQWDKWVGDAQTNAVKTASKIAKTDAAAAQAQVQARLDADRDAGWLAMQSALYDRASDLLTDDDGADLVDEDEEPDEIDSYVPSGLIRNALGIAGGFASAALMSGLGDDGQPLDDNEVMGQIGTGETIADLLRSRGAAVVGYQWSHGFSDRPFEPHLELDGETFESWTDDVLENPEGWPSAYCRPGDHDGCSCDVIQMWDTEDTGDQPADDS